ncbi:MAG TPA: hypothetical protein VNJ04_12675 [Gemmatimonadaceae bacterium]|nr:hypothetical protein [Gemmatimonadaceae bacterium]
MIWPILHHSNLKQRLEEAMRKYDERRDRESRNSQNAVSTSTSLLRAARQLTLAADADNEKEGRL